ncbi:hypothetical protein FQN54_000918 [Arachnomyces sp. PD_36]|nr:hypothetical protein FQN54_000918 [Arachnomyces sp. PD_36]
MKFHDLKSSKDWDDWYLRTMWTARQHGVWDLVNPDLKNPPELLVEPKKPIPGDARVREPTPPPGQTNPPISELVEEDLTAIERGRLVDLKKTYNSERQEYKEQQKGLNNFRGHLINTVPTIHILSALQQPTLYHTMVDLSGRFRPTQRQLLAEYNDLMDVTKIKSINLWLAKWQHLARELEVTGREGAYEGAKHHLREAVMGMNDSLDYYLFRNTEKMSFDQILKEIRRSFRRDERW